ncbi:MAG: hypothetical protein PF589_03620, partial [Gammaproteobacteria bacterium]|nr:hypothetical protein [Gammaproteobacteria bacterium]
SVLRYQINVVISGVTNINNFVVTDPIPANSTYAPATLSLNVVVQTDVSNVLIDFLEFNGCQIVVDLSQSGMVYVDGGMAGNAAIGALT